MTPLFKQRGPGSWIAGGFVDVQLGASKGVYRQKREKWDRRRNYKRRVPRVLWDIRREEGLTAIHREIIQPRLHTQAAALDGSHLLDLGNNVLAVRVVAAATVSKQCYCM